MAAGSEAPVQRLRPLGLSELLDAAIKVCTTHAATLARVVLVVVVPVQLLSAVVLASTVDDAGVLSPFSGVSDTGPKAGDPGALIGGQVAVGLLGVVAFLLSTGACFRAIAEAWLGGTPDWRESLRFAARRALPLLGITILYGLGVGFGTILLVLPGVYLFIAWSVAFPVLFVEGRGGASALGRSRELVSGRWWPTFGVIALGFILASVVSGIIQGLVSLLGIAGNAVGFAILATTVAGVVSSLITTPFQAAIISLVYFDLRVRKEGFDLELLVERLGTSADRDAGMHAPPPTAPAFGTQDTYTEAERAQAPYWPPPPGWRPERTSPPGPAAPDDLATPERPPT